MAWIIIFAALTGGNLRAAMFAAVRGSWLTFAFNVAVAMLTTYKTYRAVADYERDFVQYIDQADD